MTKFNITLTVPDRFAAVAPIVLTKLTLWLGQLGQGITLSWGAEKR